MYQPDFYSKKAKAEGYPARSVYKLKEIDQKYRLIKKGSRILDLGCSPGSWLLWLSEKIGEKGEVVGVDIEDIKISLKKNIRFIKKDAMELEEDDLGLEKFDAVVSDLAPFTSGVKFADAEKTLDFCRAALAIAEKILKPGGAFLCKIFDSQETSSFFKEVQKRFKFAKRFRPKAVKKASREIYIIAKDFIPRKDRQEV